MSAGMQTRWVTFDCFGTLVNWQAGFARMLAPIAGDDVSHIVDAYDACERFVERETPHRSYRDVMATALVRAAAEHGVPLSDRDARAVPRAWSSMPLFDDVEPMLTELRRQGWRLAVLTNCDDDLFEMTHRTFRQPFDLFVTAERVRGYKPAPWHFRAFERLTRATPRNWVHVACSWYHDIEPAQTLGINRVWLDRGGSGGGTTPKCVRVHSAAGVAGAIGALFADEAVQA